MLSWNVPLYAWRLIRCGNVWDSSLASLSDRTHPAVLLTIGAQYTGLLDTIHSGNENGGDLLDALSAKQSHLVLHQQRNTRANEHGIALKNVDIPQPSGFIQCEMTREDAGEHVAEVQLGIMVRELDEVLVQGRRLVRQRLQQQVVS